ncbi:MAG: threonine--tRNA ligase [Ignisphaera sp.]|nr:threonine--tRNA ligase [Ignisphaera sp.]MCX8167471.1 threonine--tRNA ligase [Ignisphaera sp.]MDW8084665.1 threonine--tRNA ligase [Ignisphaera sp.]
MRLLLIHAKTFSYKARERAIEEGEDVEHGNREGVFENALVVFVTVEEDDGRNPAVVVDKAANDVMDVVKKVSASTVVIYPYAHLSSSLAPPKTAINILDSLKAALSERGARVTRAPFGWYKEFVLHCYGHPLSELSRQIVASEEATKRTFDKKYYILTTDGKLVKPEEYEFKESELELKILVDKEVFRKEFEGGQGRVQYYLRKFGFEWEEYSDRGHLRYEPHATLILEAVSAYSWRVANSLGIPIFRVRGTNMFDLNVEPIKQHAALFGERMYEVKMDIDRFVLRFAACHQQFSILKDWVLSYRDLPIGMFEIADSYRYEQRGELILGFRLRRFHMPDLHILTRDLEEAKRIALIVREKIMEEVKKVGRDYQAIYNVTEDYLNMHFNHVVELVKREGKPVLLVVYPAGIYYWVINVEYVIIDELNRPREIATWQIDVGNAKRFGIKYVDENNMDRHPIVIHTAIIGSIERYIYMIFDKIAHDEMKGISPTLPLWLSPIQVRLIPVSKDYIEYATNIARILTNNGIRIDIDDRDESLGKKIRDAGVEWIPYVVVVGEREVKTNTINVRIRKSGVQRTLTLEEFIKILNEELNDYPKIESTLPLHLSKRPKLYYLQPLTV